MDGVIETSAFRAAISALAAGRPAEAVPLLEAAIARGEAPGLAQLNLGFALMDSGRLAEAEQLLLRLAPVADSLPDWHARLGHLAALRGDWAAARPAFERTLERAPDHVPALAGLAMIELRGGRPEAAEARLREALCHAPDEPELRLRLAEARLAQGDGAEAGRIAESLLDDLARPGAVGPQLALAWLKEFGTEEATRRLRELAAAAPLCPARAVALATVLDLAGNREDALPQWRLAGTLAPDDPDVQASLGRALRSAGQYEEAAAALARAAAARPQDEQLHVALAEVRFRQFRLAEAASLYGQGLARFGRLPILFGGAAITLAYQGLQEEGARLAEAASSDPGLHATVLASVSPYAMSTGTAEALHRNALVLRERLASDVTPFDRRAQAPGKRLRVGFLSPSFGRHPVGWLTILGLEHLPRDGFEVVLLSLRTLDGALARRFRARADRWVDLSPNLGDLELAQRLREEQLDMLVDLGGHGEGGRLAALRHRAAPVQLKWVGSQSGPTGVPNIDWMIADRWEIPEAFEPFYTERALRLRDGYVCYAPPPYAPPVAPLPALRRGHVTFACFNNLAKITPEVLACWARILAALPDARLVLRNHALADTATREAFLARAAALGLDLARVETHGPSGHEALLAAYGEVDISLDPFPYTGGLTVCESLWMGVPVVTLAGESFAARHATSHLCNIGLDDWVTHDPDAYVEEAVRRARALSELAALREGLRPRVAASPLGDGPRFGESLALALREAWREACAREAT